MRPIVNTIYVVCLDDRLPRSVVSMSNKLGVARSVVVMPEVGRCRLVDSQFPVTLTQAQYRIVGMRNGRFDGRRPNLECWKASG